MSTSPTGLLSGNGTLQQLGALYQKMAAKLAAPATSTPSTTSPVPTDTDNVSGIGRLLSNLEDLATSNPAKFKQETGEIAASLKAAASNTTGNASSTFKDLASQFQQASDTGDASALAPKQQSYSTSGVKYFPRRQPVQQHQSDVHAEHGLHVRRRLLWKRVRQFQHWRSEQPHEPYVDAEHRLHRGQQFALRKPGYAAEQPVRRHKILRAAVQ